MPSLLRTFLGDTIVELRMVGRGLLLHDKRDHNWHPSANGLNHIATMGVATPSTVTPANGCVGKPLGWQRLHSHEVIDGVVGAATRPPASRATIRR